MPIYEYRCTECQHKLEALQKFSDAQLTVCPQCGRDALTKLVSAAGFHLKGSGWYQTDFKHSGSKPAAKPEAAAGETKAGETKTSETTTGETKTTDATPTTKPEAATTKADTAAAPAGSPPAAR